jgi:hypothetical protein
LQDAKNNHQAQAPHIQSEDLRLPAPQCANNELDFIFFMNLSEPFNPQLKPKPSGKPLAVTVMPSR